MGSETQLSTADWLRDCVDRNRRDEKVGLFSVCSAHPRVLEAAMAQAREDGSMLCVESTSNQANQFGGYTGLTPKQFIESLRSLARKVDFPAERILLGGDHLGPYPWRKEPSSVAMQKAAELVRNCVLAGYIKIHLDASMACADDKVQILGDEIVAERAALLCEVAERAWSTLSAASPPLMYVIGTEVPIPGGETSAGGGPQPTEVDHVNKTLEITRSAFLKRGLAEAWKRVIGLVVQPGVEFGDSVIFDYDRSCAKALSHKLPVSPALVYEAHSTDYQTSVALRQMVEDHFAILKVGPWLTFAYREAIFALSAIEEQWLGVEKAIRRSQVRKALEEAMLRNPTHWKAYYAGDERAARFARRYSFSDRCRYYWPESSVQDEVDLLLSNLSKSEIPLALLSQYLPQQYEGVRQGVILNRPENLIDDHIRRVLKQYSAACRP